jgi:hypothetical protein
MRSAMTLGAVAELAVHCSIMRLAVTVFACKDHLMGAAMAEYAFQRCML